MFEPRISIVTLGVADIAASTAFYERIGFSRTSPSSDSVSFFQLWGGLVFGLYGHDALAEDAGMFDGEAMPRFRGVSLAYNVRHEREVAETLAIAVDAGAKLIKAGQKVFWGGTSGYFADPDGHLWEVAHNPFVEMTDTGSIRLPKCD